MGLRFFQPLFLILATAALALQIPLVQEHLMYRFLPLYLPEKCELKYVDISQGFFPFSCNIKRLQMTYDGKDIDAQAITVQVDWWLLIHKKPDSVKVDLKKMVINMGKTTVLSNVTGYLNPITMNGKIEGHLLLPVPAKFKVIKHNDQIDFESSSTNTKAPPPTSSMLEGVKWTVKGGINTFDRFLTLRTLYLQDKVNTIILKQPIVIKTDGTAIGRIALETNKKPIEIRDLQIPWTSISQQEKKTTQSSSTMHSILPRPQVWGGILTLELQQILLLAKAFGGITVPEALQKIGGKVTLSLTGKNTQLPLVHVKLEGHHNSIPLFPMILTLDSTLDLNGDNLLECRASIITRRWFAVAFQGRYYWHFAQPHKQHGEIKMHYKAFLKPITLIAEMDDIIQGKVEGSLKINLPPVKDLAKKIQFSGTGYLTGGLYNNPQTGTFYEKIDCQIVAKDHHIFFDNIIGYDRPPTKKNAKPNPVTGKAVIDLTDLTAPKIDLRLDFNDVIIADADDFFSRATGYLQLKNSEKQVTITGDINLNKSKLALEESGEISVPTVKIINKRNENRKNKVKKVKYNRKNPLAVLDIRATIKGPFLVKGFGLRSEWTGALGIKGCITDPYLIGQATIKSGRIEIIGRALKIKRGSITYFENDPDNPILSLVAYHKIDEKSKAFLKIDGTLSSPKFQFTSNKGFSEEDCLSFILFGRRSVDVSVVQAVQLASAMATLKGKKGFDLPEQLRHVFKLANIDIKDYRKKDDDDIATGKTLSIAKKIGIVTVSVEQGTSSDSSRVTVSAPVGKNINVEAYTGVGSGVGGGFTWAKRY